MRDSIGAEVLEPAAFGTSVLLNKSPYSRPFISHVPFDAVPPQPSIRRSIWTVVHWLFWLSLLYFVYEYFHLSIMWYIHGLLKGNGLCGIIRWIQIRLLYVPVKWRPSSSYSRSRDSLSVDTETLSKMSRRQQELKICFSMHNAKTDPTKTAWFVWIVATSFLIFLNFSRNYFIFE